MAVLKAVQFLLSATIFAGNRLVSSDSQDEIKSVTNVDSTFALNREYRGFLAEILDHSNVSFIWVRGHRDIIVNCFANVLVINTADPAIFEYIGCLGYRRRLNLVGNRKLRAIWKDSARHVWTKRVLTHICPQKFHFHSLNNSDSYEPLPFWYSWRNPRHSK